MKNSKIWINKKILDKKDARISVFDRGFLYGDGLFETMRAYAGIIFRLDDHLDRLCKASKILKIKLPYSRGYLTDCIYSTLEANRLKSAYLRLTVTRGVGEPGVLFDEFCSPNVVIIAKDFKDCPEVLRNRGISAKVVSMRQNERSAIANEKTLNFLNYILAKFDARLSGFDEAILMNTKDEITEASASNIFLVKKNKVITPYVASGILPGIARSLVLGIARRLRLRPEERPVYYRELFSADEVFITNSIIEVLPVTRLDSRRVANGLPGEVTKLMHVSYQKEVIREVFKLTGSSPARF